MHPQSVNCVGCNGTHFGAIFSSGGDNAVESLWLPQVVTNSVAPTPATEQLCDLPGPLPNLWGPVLEHYGATAGAFANHFAHQVHATTSRTHHAHKWGLAWSVRTERYLCRCCHALWHLHRPVKACWAQKHAQKHCCGTVDVGREACYGTVSPAWAKCMLVVEPL